MKQLIFLLLLSTLISCNYNKTKPAETLVVEAPVTEPAKVDSRDSAYLRIKLVNAGYEVSLFEKSLRTDQAGSVDSFMLNNKGRINTNKVLIIGYDSLESFKQLKPVLLKYDISKFAMEKE